ncbi:MAG TPA: nucleoside-diphosphate sugar epimerase/dehydratase [Gemmatimonadales bacterium]
MRRRALIVMSQIGLAAVAYAGAFGVAYDLRLPSDALGRLARTLPWLIAIRLVISHRFKLDRSYWQHVGLTDAVNIVEAVTIGSIIFPLTLLALGRLSGIPLSVFVIDWLLVIALTTGVRVAARFARERSAPLPVAAGRPTLIVGAGEAGEQLLRQILHDPRHLFNVVGLIDDDTAKIGLRLHGVPVVGGTGDLRRLAAVHSASVALIAIPSAGPEELRRIVDRCVGAGCEVKLLPPLQDLMTGDVQMSAVRDVEIEDLLGREPIQLDLDGGVEPELAGKVILVTGAGGSIGSELARQVARFHPAQLILFERAESPLYFIQHEICRSNPALDIVPVLASVTNSDRLEQVFENLRPDVVFHAAAYKHVPMLEANVVEGVWNNVMGTLRLARAAARAGTRKFVCISTDKAVNPTSVLGTTKRVGERIVLELPSLQNSSTDFRVVRFGNVLGSDGSVVPLFKRQLNAGGPITVTHPDVTRYFMTIPEAVQLVLQSISLQECAGRIALLEMGTPIRIVDLAEQLIRLSGRVPGKDVEIVFTGLRPGEKLEEELVAPGEQAVPTTIEKIRVVERSSADGTVLAERLRHLLHLMARHDEPALLRALDTLIPEYAPALRELPHAGNGNGRLVAHTGNGNGKHTNGNGKSHANGNGNGRARRTLSIRDARIQAPIPIAIQQRRTGTISSSARTPRKGTA